MLNTFVPLGACLKKKNSQDELVSSAAYAIDLR